MFKTKFVYLIVFLLVICDFNTVKCQQKEHLEATADSLFNNYRFTESLKLYNQLLVKQSETHDRLYYKINLRITECLWRLEKLEESKSLLQQVFTQLSESDTVARKYLPEWYYQTSVLYYFQNKFDSANRSLQKSIAYHKRYFDKPDRALANFYNLKGIVALEINELDSAIFCLEKDIEIIQSSISFPKSDLAYSYSNLAMVYSQMQYYEKAIYYQNMAVDIDTKYSSNVNLVLAEGLLNLSNYKVFYKGSSQEAFELAKKGFDLLKNEKTSHRIYAYIMLTQTLSSYMPDSAIYYGKAGLQLMKKRKRQDPLSEAQLLTNIGLSYQELDSIETSISYFEKALEKKYVAVGKNDSEYFNALWNLASAYFKQSDFPKMNSYLKKLMKITQLYPEIHFAYYSNVYRIMGLNKQKEKQYDSAAYYYNKAKESNSLNIDGEIIVANLIESVQIAKANTLLVQNQFTNGDIENTDIVINAFMNLIKRMQSVRNELNTQIDRNNLDVQLKEVCVLLLEFIESVPGQRSQDYKEESFFAFEAYKANNLKSYVNIEQSNCGGEVLKNSESQISKLKAGITYHKSKLLTTSTADSISYRKHSDLLFYKTRLFNDLMTELRKACNNTELPIVTLSAVQTGIESNQAIIQFLITDDRLFYLLITADATKSGQVPINNQLEEIIRKQLKPDLLSVEDHMQALESSGVLYNLLVKPLELTSDITRLIFIPDGKLWYVNYDLLHPSDSFLDIKQIKSAPFLIKKYSISLASMAASAVADPAEAGFYEKECLAFSYSGESVGAKTDFLTLRNDAADLPGTKKEITLISKILDGDYFYGSEAHELNFKKNVSNYRIVHLAIHGEVDDKDHEKSRLYFGPSTDTLEDNRLYVYELPVLKIPAELTVLSACNSGIGEVDEGEGIISIGQAFQYAGSKSLLLTRWPIPDDATPKLMAYFYKGIKSGLTKDEALRQAKLHYIQEADNIKSNPFFWSSFYLMGNPALMEFEQESQYYVYYVIGLLLLLGLLVILKKKLIF